MAWAYTLLKNANVNRDSYMSKEVRMKVIETLDENDMMRGSVSVVLKTT